MFPGATAIKVPPNSPGNPLDMTNAIVVTGLEAVDTSSPTPDNKPWVVSYDVQDTAVPPNKASTVRRRVVVREPSSLALGLR